MIYGRCASKKEIKYITRSDRLPATDGLVPVFNCPSHLERELDKMKPDQLKRLFRRIGVRSVDGIVLFQTHVEPEVGPVPQSNGLMEYKLPAGAPVYDAYTINI